MISELGETKPVLSNNFIKLATVSESQAPPIHASFVSSSETVYVNKLYN